MGCGTDTCLAEQIPPTVSAVGEEGHALRGDDSSRLRVDSLSTHCYRLTHNFRTDSKVLKQALDEQIKALEIAKGEHVETVRKLESMTNGTLLISE